MSQNRRRKVYDLFLVTTELDFFEIRLNELDKEVDYFVVLESATTFQMNPKPLYVHHLIFIITERRSSSSLNIQYLTCILEF